MKTFKTFFYILVIALVLGIYIFEIVEYRNTKDEESISSEELKQLKKSHLTLFLLMGATIIIEHLDRLFD